MLFTPIGGYSGSSTRTELAAAIIAISSNGPIHIGTDSQAFMDRAVRIINSIKNNTKHYTNWKTTSDGDLWQHFEEAVKAKGPHAIKITKVKGHATQEQVNNNIYRQCDKLGNDRADEAADIAVKLHGDDLVEVARQMAFRIYEYTKFMKNVAMHIIEGYLIHRKLLEYEAGLIPKEPKHVAYQGNPISISSMGIHQPLANGFEKLDISGDINNFNKYASKHPAAHNCVEFLKHIKCKKPENGAHATTWIELYILYRIHGFGKPVQDKGSKAGTKASTAQQIAQFKNNIRGVVARTIYNPNHIQYFKPHKTNTYKYKGLAIDGIQVAVNMDVFMTDAQRASVERHIIRLGHFMSDDKVQKFRGAEVKLKPGKLRLTGKVAWDAKLKHEYQLEVDTPMIHDITDPVYFNSEAVISCPHCDHATTTIIIKSNDLDGTSKCTKCKKNVKAKDWKCVCKKPWHTCDFHKFSTTSSSKYSNISKDDAQGTSKATKRTFGPLTQEELINIDNKRRKWSSPAIYQLAPTLLSAKLRDRFAHIL